MSAIGLMLILLLPRSPIGILHNRPSPSRLALNDDLNGDRSLLHVLSFPVGAHTSGVVSECKKSSVKWAKTRIPSSKMRESGTCSFQRNSCEISFTLASARTSSALLFLADSTGWSECTVHGKKSDFAQLRRKMSPVGTRSTTLATTHCGK